MTATLIYTALLFTAFGIGIGIMAACWKPKKRANYQAPYFKGNGDPQPGVWSPYNVTGHQPVKVYPSIDVWARENGVV